MSEDSSSFAFLAVSPFLVGDPSPVPPTVPVSTSFTSPNPFAARPVATALVSDKVSTAVSSA